MRSCRTLLRAVSRPQPALIRSRPSCLAQIPRRTLILLRQATVVLPGPRYFSLATCLHFSTLVTPGISALEYHERRANLAKALPKNTIAVLASSDIKYRSGAVFYEFHQEPNFFYLTGNCLLLRRLRKMDTEQPLNRLQRARSTRCHWWVRRKHVMQ
jgi:intermediate cleaving peptidase 55